MPRPKTSPKDTAIIEAAPVVVQQHEDIQQAGAERMAIVLREFGDGLPFDEARYEHVIRGHLSRSAEEMLAAGRALVVSKECMRHGAWTPFIERIGLEPRMAQYMMRAAVKFSRYAKSTSHLLEAAKTKTKLFELLVLDDEEIKELAEGGTVAGLQLDDIADMPASELRKRLRDNKEEKKATDALMADKDTKINTLTAELRKARTHYEKASVDDKLKELATAVAGAALDIESQIRGMFQPVIKEFLELQPSGTATVAGHATMIRQALEDVCNEFAVPTMQAVPPDWAQED